MLIIRYRHNTIECLNTVSNYIIINQKMMKRRSLLPARKAGFEPSGLTKKQDKSNGLLDHTSKIQQKLAKLKQQIEQKKRSTFNKTKQKIQIKNQAQKNIKSAVIKKQNRQKKQTEPNIDGQLKKFMESVSMQSYLPNFIQNGIDSLDILKQIKQKQLQQIGVTKGHALKIIVTLKKISQSRNNSQSNTIKNQQIKKKQKIDNKAKNSPQNNVNDNRAQKTITNKQQQKCHPLQIVIQTQGNSEEISKRKYFCLYCYQVSINQYCNSECEKLYNKMFEKYEKNLAKVQQLYGSKLEPIQQYDQQQDINEDEFVSSLGFLDFQQNQAQQQQQFVQKFDQQAYREALQFIKITSQDIKKQSQNKLSLANNQQWNY